MEDLSSLSAKARVTAEDEGKNTGLSTEQQRIRTWRSLVQNWNILEAYSALDEAQRLPRNEQIPWRAYHVRL